MSRFPQEFNFSDVSTVIAYARGQGERTEALEAAWWLLGYGLSKVPPSYSSMASASLDGVTDESMAAELQTAFAPQGVVDGIPWAVVLPILLRLAERWLSR